MASTRHTASEHIKNGRTRLVKNLQNLSLIVENLYQRKVIHKEEVSKIEAEVDNFEKTRKILDCVTAKGEAACYELLAILNHTRKRTLNDPELESWISSFPFREDTEITDYLVGNTKLMWCPEMKQSMRGYTCFKINWESVPSSTEKMHHIMNILRKSRIPCGFVELPSCMENINDGKIGKMLDVRIPVNVWCDLENDVSEN
uniref:CARD domain-containing protein n=1 Tax=Esox lucius TaxID=8010 RepID=A0A6Q2Z3C1_ESOLU